MTSKIQTNLKSDPAVSATSVSIQKKVSENPEMKTAQESSVGSVSLESAPPDREAALDLDS
ncbi:MAG: hypothetical protein ACI4UF_09855, partial [Thermoguttaceae bacterium]